MAMKFWWEMYEKKDAIVDLVKDIKLIVNATRRVNKSHFVEKTWKMTQGK